MRSWRWSGRSRTRRGSPQELLDAARRLDRHYIPTRDPYQFDRGAPRDYFTPADSQHAIADADEIIAFSAGHLPLTSQRP